MVGAALLVALQLQTATPDVDASLREGIALRMAGDNERAVAAFQRAYGASPNALTAGQLGLAEQATGRWVEADRFLSEALAHADDAWVVRHRVALDGAYALVRQHVGSLDLRGGVDGAEVLLDGAPVATLPLHGPVRVRAGTSTLEVRAAGYYPVSRPVVIAADQTTLEPIELRSREAPPAAPRPQTRTPQALPPPPPPPVAARAAPRPMRFEPRSLRAAVLLSGGAFAAAAVAGVLLADREFAAVAFNERCGVGPYAGQPDDCRGLLDRGSVDVGIAVTGFAIAAALVPLAVWAASPVRRAAPPVACAPTRDGHGGGCAIAF